MVTRRGSGTTSTHASVAHDANLAGANNLLVSGAAALQAYGAIAGNSIPSVVSAGTVATPTAPTLTVADWSEWLNGATITLTATTTDSGVTMKWIVTPYGGGAETELAVDASSPFSANYVNALAPGWYTLKARAIFTVGGGYADSAAINVYAHRASTVALYEPLAANVTKDGNDYTSALVCSVTGDANKDYAQGNGSFVPLWTGSDPDYNNRPSLALDSVRHTRMRTGVWAVALPAICTRLVVGKQSATVSGYRMLLDGIAGANRTAIFSDTATANTGTTNATGAVVATTPNGLNPFVEVAVVNGASSKLYRTAHTAIATGDTGAGNTMTGSTLGADAAESVWWDGSWALELDDNTALNQAAVEDLLDWYGAKFGVTIGA